MGRGAEAPSPGRKRRVFGKFPRPPRGRQGRSNGFQRAFENILKPIPRNKIAFFSVLKPRDKLHRRGSKRNARPLPVISGGRRSAAGREFDGRRLRLSEPFHDRIVTPPMRTHRTDMRFILDAIRRLAATGR